MTIVHNEITESIIYSGDLFNTPEWKSVSNRSRPMLRMLIEDLKSVNILYFRDIPKEERPGKHIKNRKGDILKLGEDVYIITGFSDVKIRAHKVCLGTKPKRPSYWTGEWDASKVKVVPKKTINWFAINIKTKEFRRFSGRTIPRLIFSAYNEL